MLRPLIVALNELTVRNLYSDWKLVLQRVVDEMKGGTSSMTHVADQTSDANAARVDLASSLASPPSVRYPRSLYFITRASR